MRDGHGDRAGAGAHIQHASAGGQAGQSQFDQQFGFGTGNQYIGRHAQHQAIEFALPDQIGDRFALQTALHQPLQGFRLRRRQDLFVMRDELHARQAGDMAQQDARLQRIQRRLLLPGRDVGGFQRRINDA